MENRKKVKDHYVTVTGFRIDRIKKENWLQISTWGKKRYIDYNEYLFFSMGKSLFSNIVYIKKRGD